MCSFVGTRIYGYCEGYFGRDDYSDKIIILDGCSWIVCAYLDGWGKERVTHVNFDSPEEKVKCIKKWSVRDDDWDEEDW